MSSKLDQMVRYRLGEIYDVWASGDTALTGKGRREVNLETGEVGGVSGRFGGGMSNIYPELRAVKSPAQAAGAIRRGKGVVFRRLYDASARYLIRRGEASRARKRSPEKPVIPPHPRLTKKCKRCKVAHGKGEHRFHGKGSFHTTHAFAVNPPIPERFKEYLAGLGYLPAALRPDLLAQLWKVASLRKGFERWEKGRGLFGGPMLNPKKKISRRPTKVVRKSPTRLVRVYGRVLRIEAQKTGKHRCDDECKKFKHRYFHDFRLRNVRMYGMPDGSLLIKAG